MATLSLQNIRKAYGTFEAIKGIDLEIEDRDFTVFVGPSGCGKTTLLRMIAGLEEISGGDLLIDGQRMNDVGPADRGLAMVFQSYALYPHMTVAGNMAFALRLAGVPKAERERKVLEAAKVLQLDHLLHRRPRELSGGQRQRVAIGRSIVRNPRVFLFDEPLSNLDAALRVQMRVEIAKLHERLKATTIYVTHDQIEAMTMATRIVVLNGGHIEQVGSPLELYHHPANLFVAGFIGAPKMNMLAARVTALGANDVTVTVAGSIAIRVPVLPAGLRIGEPAADLAAAAALVSSALDRPLPQDCVVFGEISLSGDVRGVGRMESRLKEAAKLGFGRALAPAAAAELGALSVAGAVRLDQAVQRIADEGWA